MAVDYKSVYIVHPDCGGLRKDPARDHLREDPQFEAICSGSAWARTIARSEA